GKGESHTELVGDLTSASNNRSTVAGEEPSEEDSTIEVEREQEELLAELESPEVSESIRDRRHKRIPKDSLFIRFRKIPCEAAGQATLHRNAVGEWVVDTSNLQAALNEQIARAQQIALNDPERIRTTGAPDARVRVPETALASEMDYNTFLQSLQTDVVPEWRLEVSSEVRPTDTADPTKQIVSIEFVNTSPQQNNPNLEPFLFDTFALFMFRGANVQPFELELAPRGFRYDRHLWGRGFNCAVERQENWPDTFFTTHAPIFCQMRYVTQDNPPARFADLASNPLPILRAIVNSMEAYRQIWDQERQEYIAADSSWEAHFGAEFDHDRQRFEAEINRFRRGCELIRTNADVRLAFQLTNETFRRLGSHPRPEKRKESWRLFQIVFLVSQIPGIMALTDPNSPDTSEREIVDIVYFPTGGGKTEAYLGTVVFHCFFDRLRGEVAGVTAWLRFPLRLLTLQQT
ncbi:MAG: hypothetical protein MN733_26630, partial [Nitrososphaera sp.]|nr:hypothetical protein [Nitrososphaera sp.]